MMRLTEDQVRQGLQYPDKDVRFFALQYFAKSFSKNTSIMPDVIELLERPRAGDAFAFSFPIADLAQTEDTIKWAVGRLQRRSTNEEERNFASHIGRLLLHADPILVLPHKAVIFSSPGCNPELASRLELRLGLISTPSDQLWQRLEAICEAGKGKMNSKDIPYAEAQEIAQALARDVSQAERMMELLKQEVDPKVESAMMWLELFLVQMAGYMRYEPAIPHLIKKFDVDDDYLNESCDEALTKVGSDSVIRAVREAYPHGPSHFRLYSAGLFGDIHTDLALAAGLELLSLELDPHQRCWLATALVDQFSAEAIDAARDVLLENPPDAHDLKSSLVVACKLTNYEVAELKKWERELTQQTRTFATKKVPALAFDDFDEDSDPSPSATSEKIGRNDLCPCGSGKKYKKCCLNKPKAPR